MSGIQIKIRNIYNDVHMLCIRELDILVAFYNITEGRDLDTHPYNYVKLHEVWNQLSADFKEFKTYSEFISLVEYMIEKGIIHPNPHDDGYYSLDAQTEFDVRDILAKGISWDGKIPTVKLWETIMS